MDCEDRGSQKKERNKKTKQAAVEFLTLIFYHLSFTGSQVALYTGQCCASEDLNQPANQINKQEHPTVTVCGISL